MQKKSGIWGHSHPSGGQGTYRSSKSHERPHNSSKGHTREQVAATLAEGRPIRPTRPGYQPTLSRKKVSTKSERPLTAEFTWDLTLFTESGRNEDRTPNTEINVAENRAA